MSLNIDDIVVILYPTHKYEYPSWVDRMDRTIDQQGRIIDFTKAKGLLYPKVVFENGDSWTYHPDWVKFVRKPTPPIFIGKDKVILHNKKNLFTLYGKIGEVQYSRSVSHSNRIYNVIFRDPINRKITEANLKEEDITLFSRKGQ